MIPSVDTAKQLWEKYHLPKEKRIHASLVADVAVFLARRLCVATGVKIDIPLLQVAALLHDIDKSADTLPGEKHPDTAVRILRSEGMAEVAEVVQSHPLHTILDNRTAPKTPEEKLLFLADKMVKYEILTVDMRFSLWRKEELTDEARNILRKSYPVVKLLEKEICSAIGIRPDAVAKLA